MTDPKKVSSWLAVLILVTLGISVSPHQVLTRTTEVDRALNPVLSDYEVIRLEPGDVEQQVRTTGELRFRFKENAFYFKLEPHDLRSPNYRAVETGPGGITREISPGPVRTFKGKLSGQEDTQGRFTITANGIEGVVYAPEDWYYLEPLRNYFPGADATESVVYRHSDIKPGQAWKCGVSVSQRLQRGVNQVEAQVEAGAATNYVVEVATEADFEYVQALGGSEAANREIESIMNQVEGVYQSELLLQLRISFQHTWATEEDPYTATKAVPLLDEFAAHWDANFAANESYDVAHIWTAKELEFSGVARLATVCSDHSLGYSLSSRYPIPFNFILAAHEIGHNLGAVHPDEVNPRVAGCINTIMQSEGGASTGLTFCEFSRDEIGTHVGLHNGCLTTRPISLQPPTDLTATAVSSSGIDLNWRDNSINETGFRLHRRRDGTGNWIEIGTVAANATSFSNRGLLPNDTHHYRVRAINDTESSAFSNEAAATTPDGPQTGAFWTIDTIAGGGLGDNDLAIEAQLSGPTSVAMDAAGNLFIADIWNHRIRRVNAAGIITTIAGTGSGGLGGFSGDNGPAINAGLNAPNGVAVDAAGNLYIADTWNNRIRRVNSSGIITTIAGTGEKGYGGDGGRALAARLYLPRAVAVDGAGNIYIVDSDNYRIRRIDSSGTITTIAGTGEWGFSGDGGPAVQAQLAYPQGVAVDAAGNLFIADTWNHRVRRVDPSGIITTIAGTGERGYSGDGGPAAKAQIDVPHGMAVDGAGNLFIVDSDNGCIRRVDASGTITTIVGTGQRGFGGDGGPAVEAQLSLARDVAVDAAGNLYVADTRNDRIRWVDAKGIITTIAGGGSGGDGGPAVEARLNSPSGVAVDGYGNIYVADSLSHRIRRVDAKGIITTVAGTGQPGHGGEGGPAVNAQLNWPTDVAVDTAGNLYIADKSNSGIRRVDRSGTISTIANTRSALSWTDPTGHSDLGPAVAVDNAGNLYVADYNRHRIFRVNTSGTITNIAGTRERGYGGDNGPAAHAQLNRPSGVAVDSGGNLYIADRVNSRIRQVDARGIITTIVGTGQRGFGGDGGPAVEAQLSLARDVAVDAAGNLYIADTSNDRIRRVDARRSITTVAGPRDDSFWTGGFAGDGGPAINALLAGPSGLAVDSAGNVYIADTRNHRIRMLTQNRPPITLQAPTRLTATTVSTSKIDLSWQDNSHNETGFILQRRQGDSGDWVQVETTAANLTSYSDAGLSPGTPYRYRVQALNHKETSAFSNEAVATTEGFAPTVSAFVPTGGPVGTWITVTGTGFLGATEVSFNQVSTTEVEVLSPTSLRAVVPPEATSGPISVVTPDGTGASAGDFTVTEAGILSRLFVPIVLRLGGQAGSFYTSELTLTNRGSQQADIRYYYTGSIGSGSGTAVDSLGAGRQRIVPDAIGNLTSLGVPIGGGGAGGTLQVDLSGLSSALEGAVTVRTATPVPDGRAGLAYLGLNALHLLNGPAWLTGLRQNTVDRSNLALQNAGDEGITLRVTVFSGDPLAPGSRVFPEKSLGPGEFFQYNAILDTAGFEQGYAKVERVSGTSPYYAYGVINDQANSDGSFVFPVREDALAGQVGQTLPVIVETEFFSTELTVTNVSATPKTVDFSFVADAIRNPDHTARFRLSLQSGEQRMIPHIVHRLRQASVAGIGPAGPVIAGALFATASSGDMSGIVIGARTGSPGGGGQ